MNKVQSFVKAFRAYFTKGRFKAGKNHVLNVPKDDSQKAISKRMHQISGIKDKNQVIEEAFGVEGGMNVRAIYAKNFEKQRIHSKIYLENNASVFKLRKSIAQAVPEGGNSLAYSHKSYESEYLTPQTNYPFHIRSRFSRHYTYKPINSPNTKDVNSPAENQTSFIMNNNQPCPYCQCRMKYIEERRNCEMQESYTPFLALNDQEKLKEYNSATISSSECKTSFANNNKSAIGIEWIDSVDEARVISRKENQTSVIITDHIPNTCQHIPKNIEEQEYDEKSSNTRSFLSTKGGSQEKQKNSDDEAGIVYLNESQNNFKTSPHIPDSCKTMLTKNFKEKTLDQSEKQTVFQNQTALTQSKTKRMDSVEEAGTIYRKESQMISKLNNHVPEGEIHIESMENSSSRKIEKEANNLRISEYVGAAPIHGPFLKSVYKKKTDKCLDLTISTMTAPDAHNGEIKLKIDNLDTKHKNTTEKSSSRSDEKKADIFRIPENIGAAPVIEPFLGLTNQRESQQFLDPTMSTSPMNYDNKFTNENFGPYFQVRSYYKTVPHHFDHHLQSRKDHLKNINQMETKHRYEEDFTIPPKQKQYYQNRVTLGKIPASSEKGDKSFIKPPPPLPPLIPTDKPAQSTAMDAKSVNIGRTDVIDEIKMGEPSKSTLSEILQTKNNYQETKVDKAGGMREKVNIHHDQFGYGDPYFHIRSYYRSSPYLKDDFKYPVKGSTFVPDQHPPNAPEPDPLPPTQPKPKKRNPCDRLKKGYYDPPKRLYSTYSLHGNSSNAEPSKGRDINSVALNLESNVGKDLNGRTISKKSHTNLKYLSALRMYNIGRF